MKKEKNPERYLKMSEPYENKEIANESVNKFYEEVATLREKYKIRDILFVINDSVTYEDGEIGEFMSVFNMGAEFNMNKLAAYAYGQTSAVEREKINKLLAGTTK